jgi:pyruvate kinase
MRRRTKIVCTLGPAVDSREKLADLVEAGMNVARLNCSHGDWETRARWVEWLRELSRDVSPIAVLADLQGPKFRIGEVPSGAMEVHAGRAITVGQSPECTICIPGDAIFEAMTSGSRLLLGDGNVELKLGARKGAYFEAKALSGGLVRSRQGVTLVGRAFDVPVLTDKDRDDVYEAAKLGVDFIALSYVRQASDLRELRRLVDKYDTEIKLCAKIETREAVKDIDGIARIADLVMVARGDLGLQVDLEDVPMAQKRVIAKCAELGRPVITATQMLESMLASPRPTRAEASDVANAIIDGTDAVMLSGETATGDYPIEAVRTMARIAEKAEGMFDHASRLEDFSCHDGTEAVAHAAVTLAHSLKVKAIVTTSTSGLTPRMVSRFRPKVPILCASWQPKVQKQMAVVWGVEALSTPMPRSTDDVVELAIDAFLRHKRVKVGDQVVVTAGIPPGTPGGTNLILVRTIQ